MPALKIPLFKMKDLVLILCLLEMGSAVPAFPRQPGIPGMASLSLETMRQLGSLQGLNMLSQYSRFGYGKSFNSLWMNGLLPPPSSFPWMRPREHETQQYEYSLPVHPPPLPSQPSLQPQQPGQKAFLQPTIVTSGIQDTIQKGGHQPPVYQRQPPLQQSEGPMVQQQVAPSDKPPKAELREMDFPGPQDPQMFPIARLIARGPMPPNKQAPLYPGLFYLTYGANQLNTPGRLGIMSSEEMAGGRGGPMAYGAMFPGFGGMRSSLRGMPPNPAMGGDFTLEFDSPVAATKGPEKGEGGPQGSPAKEADEANPENQALLSEIASGPLGGLLALPKGSVPNLARGPAGQSRGPPRVTPAAADPLMTPGLAEAYETYGADVTTPLDFEEETTTDTTVTPESPQTSMPGNEAEQPQMVHDAWRFQEP
ncbi:ameloblastin [Equus asinus]|uniref:ameloblastin n=1 Tax=Equus asinus TaxID=9793 RepID=UPI000214B133|nr:ameloblastin [Equus caballus]XP_008528890.1 PREDICTED: ameloblastin [Equus przewalskii]XP_014702755.1 ameloblastin [Equus asinus]